MKINVILILASIFFTVYVIPKHAYSNDKKTSKDEVEVVLDNFHKAWKSRNVEAVLDFLSDDCLIAGTDPNDFSTKEEYKNNIVNFLLNKDLNINYSIKKREIRVVPDGKSALVIEQFIGEEFFGPHLPMRFITHHVKTKSGWIITYMGWSFIPERENFEKILKALNE